MRQTITMPLFFGMLVLVLSFVRISHAFDPLVFQDNIENKNDQPVWAGYIENITINRGPAELHLIKGELTLFDFGSGIPCALVFDGEAGFKYSPPDEIEHYQLRRLYGKDTIDVNLGGIALFFSVDLEDLPDTSDLAKKKVSKQAWRAIQKAYQYALDYLEEYMPNKLLNDILSDQPGTYLLADIWRTKFDHLIFIEDHRFDDIYRLYKPRLAGGVKTYDVLGGFTPDNSLPTERGLIPIDITHYEIDSRIDRGGDMTAECRIHFTAHDAGRQFLYWQWYEKNKPLSAFDSGGDSLTIIHNDDDWGLGVVLNRPLKAGQDDFIDIKFECEAIRNIFGIFVLEGQTYWYPLMMPWDRATYELTYECNEDYEVISCGTMIESVIENGKHKSRWLVETPVKYVSFNLGVFESEKFVEENAPPVIVYLGENYRHNENVELYAGRYGNISSANMLDMVGKDVSKSLRYFTEKFGPCPFDTVRVSEIPWGHGQGSPGLLHLTWYTFQFDDLIGTEERFRAHEVSHQWFGHIIETEHYRDTWITEGLAEYCGFMYLESVENDQDVSNTVLDNWRRDIIYGGRVRSISTDKRLVGIDNYITVVSDGCKAGPLVLGTRLNNSLAYDYQVIVYTKGAYVYHMIRFMMYDYENNSDESFFAFLRDLLKRYSRRPITTEDFKKVLEEHLGMNLDWFFKQWIYGIEIPSYQFSYDLEKTSIEEYIVSCSVLQDGVPDDFKMPVTVGVYSVDGDTSYYRCWIDKPEVGITLPPVTYEPQGVEFNVNDAVLCRVKE